MEFKLFKKNQQVNGNQRKVGIKMLGKLPKYYGTCIIFA